MMVKWVGEEGGCSNSMQVAVKSLREVVVFVQWFIVRTWWILNDTRSGIVDSLSTRCINKTQIKSFIYGMIMNLDIPDVCTN